MNGNRMIYYAKGIPIYLSELGFILKVWFYYFKLRIFHYQKDPQIYVYELFKDNEEYKQFCYNENYVIATEHYKIQFKHLLKVVSKPYRYFQLFSDKEYNYKFGKRNYFRTGSYLRVTKMQPKIYYEGIEFNNIEFDSVTFDNIVFHNCSFRNCRFLNINTKQKDNLSRFEQGFSACDFYSCDFKNCNFNNLCFSIGCFINVCFEGSQFHYCLFNRNSFSVVSIKGETIFHETDIMSPSKSFDISFPEIIGQFHVDSNCRVYAFNYFDRANYTIEKWMKKDLQIRNRYELIANTYNAIEQIWKSNFIREESRTYMNHYYQRKKAETRSKKGISRIIGFINEFVIGYGESPARAFISMLFLIILFSFIYLLSGFNVGTSEINYDITWNLKNTPWKDLLTNDYWQSLYYSFFTLITVGQGSSSPMNGVSQIIMSIELLLGSILMTLFTGTLFRKYTK